ncbi:MAG: Zn-ribbon domain-containing OB-fold protein [Candidatus Bathyarchaeota archaeon]|nr:MAG: Zn-ribbon domain-containing OB-fold protein [Candidatus Bathyarchaeota archaeon]
MAHIPLPLYASRIPQRYSMIGARCKNCRKVTFPPSRMCDCKAKAEYEEIKLSGQGKIYAYTIISVGPPEFAEQQKLTGKYGIAIIELEEGPRMVAQLTDCNPEDMKIGTDVRAVFRRIYEEEGVIRYGLKFKPTKTATQ